VHKIFLLLLLLLVLVVVFLAGCLQLPVAWQQWLMETIQANSSEEFFNHLQVEGSVQPQIAIHKILNSF
jgi:hypothetical protein